MTTLTTNPISQNQINGGVPAIAIDEATAKLTGFQSVGGALRSINFEVALLKAYLGDGLLSAANNLSDLADAVAARGNLGAKNLYYSSGTSAPSNSLGIINDFAINDNGVLYEKTGSTVWTSRIDLTTGAEVATAITAGISAHAAASDPHPIYLTQAEGDARYPLSSDLPETVDDRVAALLVAGANVSLTYNDTAGTLTIASTASGGGGASGIPYTYNDADPPTSSGQIRTLQASLNVATSVAINAADVNGDSATDITVRLKTGAIFTIAKDAANYVRFEATADYASGSVAVAVRAEQGTIATGDAVFLAIASDATSAGDGGGNGLTSQTITASQTAADGIAYICNSSSLLEVTVPSSGSRFAVSNRGTGGFKVRTSTGISIYFGTDIVNTSLKYISNTNQFSYVEFFSLSATQWIAVSSANVAYGVDNVNFAKSLYHFNETAGSTTPADTVVPARVITLVGAQTATGGKFANGLSLSAATSYAEFTIDDALSTNNFCAEFFVNTTDADTSNNHYIGFFRGSNAQASSGTLATSSDGVGNIFTLAGSKLNIAGAGVLGNEFNNMWVNIQKHIAITRFGNIFTFYIEGVVITQIDASAITGWTGGSFNGSFGTTPFKVRIGGQPFFSGSQDTFGRAGIYDEFRLTIGDPVYTAAFPPPTAAFTFP